MKSTSKPPFNSKKQNTAGENVFSKKQLLFLGGILLLTCLLYLGTLKGDILHCDDDGYITLNTAIHKLDASHVKTIFTSFYAANYHPLTSLSWAIDYAITGERTSFLFHANNLLLHLLNIVLVFLLTKKVAMTGFDTGSKSNVSEASANKIALLVSFFHAVHPMHVESVAWISERKDVLFSFFFLLSLLMYQGYLQKIKSGGGMYLSYALSLLFFLLSLLSKPAAVILPVILLLFDYLYRRKATVKLFIEKIPFFLLALLFAIITMKAQTDAIHSFIHSRYTFLQELLILSHTIVRYLFMAFIPVGLSAFHPWPQLTPGMMPAIYYFSFLVVVLLIVGIIYSTRKTRLIAFGLGFFIAGLLPVLQLIPIGGAVIAERYTYIPYLGLFYATAVLIVTFYEEKKSRLNFLKPVLPVLLILASSGYTYAAYQRTKVWQNDGNLWNDMVRQYPTTAYEGYLYRAKYRLKKDDIKGAYEDFSKLIEWRKYDSEALAFRGQIMADSGNYEGALNDFNRAIALDSNSYLALCNRSAVRMKKNDLAGALNDCNRSLQSKNDYYLTWFNRGAVKTALNDFKGAIEDFDKSLSLKPDDCSSFFGKGAAYAGLGERDSAIDSYSGAISCNPQYSDAYNNRGSAKQELNDTTGAIADYTKAVELNPSASTSYNNLGNLKFKTNDKAGACEAWQHGARLGNESCRFNLNQFCK